MKIFSAPHVLAETSEETDQDLSNKYARAVGTPEGSSLNVNACEFDPSGSNVSIVSAPVRPLYTSADLGPFDP